MFCTQHCMGIAGDGFHDVFKIVLHFLFESRVKLAEPRTRPHEKKKKKRADFPAQVLVRGNERKLTGKNYKQTAPLETTHCLCFRASANLSSGVLLRET